MKKILAILLCLFLISSFTLPSYSLEPNDGEELIKELDNSISELIEKAAKVPEIAKDADALKNVETTFQSFMKIAGNAATFLNIINGSYNFLKMIGVIKDSTAEALNNIETKLQTMDEKLNEIDSKLNDITTAMSKIQSSIDFSARTTTANTMHDRYTDFSYRYMEEGLDSLMSEYSAMIVGGVYNWCYNPEETSRSVNNIDNSRIILLYKKVGDEYQIVYSNDNEEPNTNSLNENYRLVVIENNLLPSKLDWSADNYNDNIRMAIADGISKALHSNDKDSLKIYNYDEIYSNLNTKQESYIINNVANDAVNVLLYRIASAMVNKDSDFTKKVIRVYNNYCNHLASKDDGLDALFKSYYLTHNFESEIKDDLTDICNRLAIKNGIYGLFVSNILGMSFYATSAEKENAIKSFNKSMNDISSATENGFSGYDNYCYITNSLLSLINISLKAEASVIYKKESNGNTKYISSSKEGTKISITQSLKDGSQIVDSSKLLLLKYTANSNSSLFSYDYLKKFAKGSFANDFGRIITSISDDKLVSDIKIQYKAINLSGDYFSSSYITELPGKASFEYLTQRLCRTGDYYNTETGELKSNQILVSVATYGEDHWYWRHCEAALLAGPADYSNVSIIDGNEVPEKYYNDSSVSITINYNALYAEPYEAENTKLQSSNDINPLKSFKELLNEIAAEPQPETQDDNTKEVAITSKSLIIAVIATYSVITILILSVIVLIIKKKK